MKGTKEKVVSDMERNTGIRENISCISEVMDCNEENSGEFDKPKPNFSEIYKDLLFSEQINSSGIFSTHLVLNTDTSTSHNASNSASADLSLDTHDEEIWNILEELQCSADQRIAEEWTEQCRLTGKFVSDTVFNLSNKVFSDTEIRLLEKGLDLAPIQNKINERELRRQMTATGLEPRTT